MFNQLTAWALGIGIFAIVIGIVTIMLVQFGGVVGCPASFPYYNTSSTLCYNTTTGQQFGNTTLTGNAYTTINFLNGSLGSTNGGLASWTPLIVTVVVGAGLISILLLAFGGGKSHGRY